MTWDRALWLISGLSLPLIVLFHLLARRRRELRVPSLYLWQRLLENEKPSLRLRRLVADLLLVLQLTAAALAVIALAGPRLNPRGERIIGPTVLAIDISAGMSAAGIAGESRLEEALDEAADLVRRKALSAEMAILAGGSSVRPVSGFSRSRRELLDALDTITGSDEPGASEVLLKAARALSASRPGAQTVFITDGAFPEPVRSSESLRPLIVGFGDGGSDSGNSVETGNTGIVLFDIRYLPGGGSEMAVTVGNYSDDIRDGILSIDLDNNEILSEAVRLFPEELQQRSLTWAEPLEGEMTVSFRGDEADSLPADDAVFATLDPGRRTRVALYTEGNWFLETLLATHPGVSLRTYSREGGFDPEVAVADTEADIYVFDRIAMPVPRDVPVLAIYPFSGDSPGLPLGVGGEIGGGSPVAWDSTSPVMQGVDLSRVSIGRSVRIDPVPGSRILAESSAGPLIVAADDGQRRWMALGFDLLSSSLPVNPAFPILFGNALGWLGPENPGIAAASGSTGQGWRRDIASALSSSGDPEGIELPEGGPGVVLVNPAGETVDDDAPSYHAPDRVGFWQVVVRDGDVPIIDESIGINLLSAGESDLRRRWYPAESEEDDGASGPAKTETDSPGIISPETTIPYSRPLLTVLLSASLIFLLIEWWLQTRLWRRM